MISSDNPILIVSWSVYPSQVASSVLIHNIAKELENNVVVVGEKTKEEDDWDVVNYPLYHIDPFPFKFKKGRNIFKWMTFYKSLKTIDEIVKKHNCSTVLCPFPDEYYMNLAMHLAVENNFNFYPWFHNTYLENRTGIRRWLAKRLQSRFFTKAKKVFSISQGLTEYYRSTYPTLHVETLQHGFKIPEIEYQDFNIDLNRPVKFAYSGTLSESCLDAAVRLAEVLTKNPTFELHVFGKRNVRMFCDHGIPKDKMVVYGFLEEEEFNKALNACDIMLLPHGFTGGRSEVEYQTIFPTRTIPMLYSNRPILLHSPKNVFLTEYLEQKNAAFSITTKDNVEIEAMILKFLKDKGKQRQIVQNAIKLAGDYKIEEIVEKIEKEMGQKEVAKELN
ncbi:MAG: hypothetical protein AAGA77_00605 [Bacteroidota bacterium]